MTLGYKSYAVLHCTTPRAIIRIVAVQPSSWVSLVDCDVGLLSMKVIAQIDRNCLASAVLEDFFTLWARLAAQRHIQVKLANTELDELD